MSGVLCVFTGLAVLLASCGGSQAPQCSRADSRVARGILRQAFYPPLQAGGWALPRSCPFLPSRDMYLYQEQRKPKENANRWHCNLCGKDFAGEKYMDLHMDNRHGDSVLSGPDAVCLADHCDYLRCGVIDGQDKGAYWDRALCRPSELEALRRRCEEAAKACLPPAASGMARHELRDHLKRALCAPLTCERYWETPTPEASAHGKVAYAAVTCILLVGLLLYYAVAYTHLYADNSPMKSESGLLFSTADEDQHYALNSHDRDVRSRHHQMSRR